MSEKVVIELKPLCVDLFLVIMTPVKSTWVLVCTKIQMEAVYVLFINAIISNYIHI